MSDYPDTSHPTALILPKVTTTERDLLVAELGTIIYNTTTSTVNICDVAFTAGATSWGVVTLT